MFINFLKCALKYLAERIRTNGFGEDVRYASITVNNYKKGDCNMKLKIFSCKKIRALGVLSALMFGHAASAIDGIDSLQVGQDSQVWVATPDGPAWCGRTGDQSSQSVTCTIFANGQWQQVTSPPGDWGYADSRRVISTPVGVAYCGRVGEGRQLQCAIQSGSTINWTPPSPVTDLGYGDGNGGDKTQGWVATPGGPAWCGRSGDTSSQSVTCTIFANGQWQQVTSPPGDWGYGGDRKVISTPVGMAYCGRVGTGRQLMCAIQSGSTLNWTPPSPVTDLGYGDGNGGDKTQGWVATPGGPAWCGRSGDTSSQSVTCTIYANGQWQQVTSPPGDWGYGGDRKVISTPVGAAYCGRVGAGRQLQCAIQSGSTLNWTPPSFETDLGYGGDGTQGWVATPGGPAWCGRSGDASSQSVTCTIFANGQWRQVTSPPGDWGYADSRKVISTPVGAAYCGRVGTGRQLMCAIQSGSTLNWTPASFDTDLGYGPSVTPPPPPPSIPVGEQFDPMLELRGTRYDCYVLGSFPYYVFSVDFTRYGTYTTPPSSNSAFGSGANGQWATSPKVGGGAYLYFLGGPLRNGFGVPDPVTGFGDAYAARVGDPFSGAWGIASKAGYLHCYER